MDLIAQRFVPLGTKVELQVYKVRETASGLHLPDSSPDDTLETPTALVVAVGPECKQVKRGDKVLVHQLTQAAKVKYKGVATILVHEEVILGIVVAETWVDDPRYGTVGPE